MASKVAILFLEVLLTFRYSLAGKSWNNRSYFPTTISVQALKKMTEAKSQLLAAWFPYQEVEGTE